MYARETAYHTEAARRQNTDTNEDDDDRVIRRSPIVTTRTTRTPRPAALLALSLTLSIGTTAASSRPSIVHADPAPPPSPGVGEADDSPQKIHKAPPPETENGENPVDEPSNGFGTPRPTDLLRVVADEGLPAAERAAAARTLLLTRDPASLKLVATLLNSHDPARQPARLQLLGTVPSLDPPPMGLIEPLRRALDAVAPGDAAAGPLLDALAAYQTPAAIEPVIGLLVRLESAVGNGAAAELRAKAIAALDEQTALGLGPAPADWIAWWGESASRGDAAVLSEIARAHARRAMDAERRAAEQTEALAETYRKAHPLLPEAEQSQRLAGLLRSEHEPLRELGFELAQRALLNARPLGEPVINAAADLLESSDAEMRVRAARLIDRINPPGFADRLAGNLSRETDARAASHLLRYLARRPTPAAAGAVVGWIGADGPAREPALAAGLALLETPGTDDRAVGRSAALRQALARAVADRPDARLTPTDARVLALLGRGDRLVRLLETGTDEVAPAVARLLENDPAASAELIRVARTNPRLFASAAASLRAHAPTAEGFARLTALPAPSDDAARDAAVLHARALPIDDLARAARTVPDLTLRERVLARAADAEVAELLAAEDVGADRRARILAAIAALAEVRLALGDAAGARAALAVAPADRLGAVRLRTALALGDVAAAVEAADAHPDADAPALWLDAAERAGETDAARAIAAAALDRFGDALDPDQRAALRLLAGDADPAPPAPAPVDEGPAPSEPSAPE